MILSTALCPPASQQFSDFPALQQPQKEQLHQEVLHLHWVPEAGKAHGAGDPHTPQALGQGGRAASPVPIPLCPAAAPTSLKCFVFFMMYGVLSFFSSFIQPCPKNSLQTTVARSTLISQFYGMLKPCKLHCIRTGWRSQGLCPPRCWKGTTWMWLKV